MLTGAIAIGLVTIASMALFATLSSTILGTIDSDTDRLMAEERVADQIVSSAFEQQIDDVHVQLQGLRQADAIGRRSARSRLADPQCDALTDRNDLRDRSLAVQHRNRFAIPNGAEVLTEAGFQLRNPNGPHRSIMTRNSHNAKCRRYATLGR